MTVPSGAAPVTVRLAVLRDAPRIAELSGQLGYPAAPEEIARRLRWISDDTEHAVYVAEAPGGELTGWIHVCIRRVLEADSQAEIAGLVVHESHRGRGAGRRLMQCAEQWARARGCHTVMLRSNVIRAGAHAFYEKLGYETIKKQKVFRRTL